MVSRNIQSTMDVHQANEMIVRRYVPLRADGALEAIFGDGEIADDAPTHYRDETNGRDTQQERLQGGELSPGTHEAPTG